MQRFHYSIKQKLEILELVRTGQLMRLALDFPKVTQKQINEWSEKEEQMRALSVEERQSKYILHSGPTQKYKELYQYLYQIVKVLRYDRRAVTVDYLISVAEQEDASVRQLQYSGKRSLIYRFMDYFKLSNRVITGNSGLNAEQMTEEKKTLIDDFRQQFQRKILDNNIIYSIWTKQEFFMKTQRVGR